MKKSKEVFSEVEQETPIIPEIEHDVVDAPEVIEEKTTSVDVTPVDEYADGIVTASMLNVRANPSLDANPIGTLRKGDKIRYKKVNAEWYEIVPGGFCMSKFIQ